MENIKKINENILFFNKMAEKWDQIADDDFDLIRAILKLSSIEDEGKSLMLVAVRESWKIFSRVQI